MEMFLKRSEIYSSTTNCFASSYFEIMLCTTRELDLFTMLQKKVAGNVKSLGIGGYASVMTPGNLPFFVLWMANSWGRGLLSCQMPGGGDESREQMPQYT